MNKTKRIKPLEVFAVSYFGNFSIESAKLQCKSNN